MLGTEKNEKTQELKMKKRTRVYSKFKREKDKYFYMTLGLTGCNNEEETTRI